jgi:hypothetical protein
LRLGSIGWLGRGRLRGAGACDGESERKKRRD